MLRSAMNKKGDITFQQIAVAVLVLLVLVVLIMIFTGNIRLINDDIQSCSTKGGRCTDSSAGCGSGIQKFGKFTDCTSDQVCCVTFGDT